MTYFVILDGNYADPQFLLESDGFIKTFYNYEDAKEAGRIQKIAGDCKDYEIGVICTDERNHLI